MGSCVHRKRQDQTPNLERPGWSAWRSDWARETGSRGPGEQAGEGGAGRGRGGDRESAEEQGPEVQREAAASAALRTKLAQAAESARGDSDTSGGGDPAQGSLFAKFLIYPAPRT